MAEDVQDQDLFEDTEQGAGEDKTGTATVEKEAGEEKTGEAAGDVSAEDIMSDAKSDNVAKAKAGTPFGVQKKIDKLTRKVAERDEEIEKLKSSAVPVDRPKPPVATDFEDSADFSKAMVEWKDADDAWKNKNSTAKQRQEEVESHHGDRLKAYDTNSQRMREKYPDFDDTVDHAPYADHIVPVILESDLAPEIGYFLAKNPAELQRIQSLSPIKAAVEVGILEAKFQSIQKNTVSKAPPVINELEGKDGGEIKEVNDKTPIDEWMRHEKKRRLEKIKKKFE
jgi:hypothetical protein